VSRVESSSFAFWPKLHTGCAVDVAAGVAKAGFKQRPLRCNSDVGSGSSRAAAAAAAAA